MSVRTEELKDSKPAEREETQRVALRPEPVSAPLDASQVAGAVGLVIVGGLLWLAGAKYTLIGWVAGLNWFLGWLEIPARVPSPAGWWMLLMVPLGLLYSLVEVKRPWKRKSKRTEKIILYWLIWAALVASDVGSTFAGVRNPGPGAWPVTLQVAASIPAALAWAIVLTFIPEWMIGGAHKLLRR